MKFSQIMMGMASVLPALLSASVLAIQWTFPKKRIQIPFIILAGLFLGAIFAFLLSSRSGPYLAALACNVAGTGIFLLGFHRFEQRKLAPWTARLEAMRKTVQDQEDLRVKLKNEAEDLERETIRTVRTYGVVKGLGEALSWEEMAAHMDYAVQNCMGFRDYSLYLMDDNWVLQKILSRGSRMLEAPLEKPSISAQWHAKGSESYLEIPIRKADKLIALIWMRALPSMTSVPKETVLNQAQEISEELVMGLEKARLFSSLEKLSQFDGLTGVHRRQVFNERLNEEIRRAKAFRTTFSLLLLDLDHFKSVNDTFGHQAGDEVLKRVGKILRESIYETDFVARYGGEEFIVLLPQAEAQGVQRKAEAIRKRMESEKFVFGWNEIGVTTSIGIAHYPANGQDPAALLSVADKALYSAKESGRNRVVDSSQIW